MQISLDLDSHAHWKESACMILKRNIQQFHADLESGDFHCDDEIIKANSPSWCAICKLNGILGNAIDLTPEVFLEIYPLSPLD